MNSIEFLTCSLKLTKATAAASHPSLKSDILTFFQHFRVQWKLILNPISKQLFEIRAAQILLRLRRIYTLSFELCMFMCNLITITNIADIPLSSLASRFRETGPNFSILSDNSCLSSQ